MKREPRRVAGCGAPAPLRAVILVATLCLLVVAGCARMRQEGGQEGAQEKAQESGQALSPRFIRVSVYVTDARTNLPVADAEVVIGPEQLLPTPLPREYGDDPAGLYASETLEGGTYLFRVRRSGYRALIGRLTVPPVPERIGREDPPVVLEPEDQREAGEAGPSFRVMVLWQKYKRLSAESQASQHPPMAKPSGISPHTITTNPIGAK